MQPTVATWPVTQVAALHTVQIGHTSAGASTIDYSTAANLLLPCRPLALRLESGSPQGKGPCPHEIPGAGTELGHPVLG